MIRTVSKFSIEGIHNWPEAKEISTTSGYLNTPHRHMFHIEIHKQVSHSDRDVEFIEYGRSIKQYLYQKYSDSNGICQFNRMSCEDIGIELLKQFDLVEVHVFEDDENGAIVTI